MCVVQIGRKISAIACSN